MISVLGVIPEAYVRGGLSDHFLSREPGKLRKTGIDLNERSVTMPADDYRVRNGLEGGPEPRFALSESIFSLFTLRDVSDPDLDS